MKKFIQIRGCMGSGKTSIARQYINKGNFEVNFIDVFGKKYPYTIDKARSVIVTGRYDNRVCGGLDGVIKKKEVLREYLVKLMKLNPSVIVFEAVMYGITFKFANDLNSICKNLGFDFIGIALVAPFEVILERISSRNGGKPIKVDGIEKQYTRALVSTKKLLANGIDVRIVNTVQYKKEDMHKILEGVI